MEQTIEKCSTDDALKLLFASIKMVISSTISSDLTCDKGQALRA